MPTEVNDNPRVGFRRVTKFIEVDSFGCGLLHPYFILLKMYPVIPRLNNFVVMAKARLPSLLTVSTIVLRCCRHYFYTRNHPGMYLFKSEDFIFIKIISAAILIFIAG